MTLNSKIREIISAYKLSDRQFAIKIGVTQSVIGSMFQKGTEPSSKVIRNTLIAFPEISADWFIRDCGEMLNSQSREMERINKLNGIIESLQEVIDSKNAIIKELSEHIKQLESKLEK